MNSKKVIVVAVAVGCAVTAGILAKGIIGTKPEKEIVSVDNYKKVDVLVAEKDVPMGEKLTPGTVSWQTWPESAVTPVMITKAARPEAQSEFEAARARENIIAGEPLSDKKIVKSGESGFMSWTLSKGMQAVSIGVVDRSTAAGFVLPDDRVDILVTVELTQPAIEGLEAKGYRTDTVITNARVLAVNQVFKGNDAITIGEIEKGDKKLTLELTPEQARILMTVSAKGELSVALRSVAENDDKNSAQQGPQLAEQYTESGQEKQLQEVKGPLFMRYGVTSYNTKK